MTSAAVAGCTGFVGSHILSTLLADPSVTSLHAFTRRALSQSADKLHLIESSDPATGWPSSFPADTPIFFSALGTTRAAAGSLAAQRAIDVDLNLALARSAKEKGASTYVLVSSGGANAKSHFPYMQMKGELEEAVKAIGFDHVVILRPGLLRGREKPRLGERLIGAAFSFAGKVGGKGVEDGMAQNGDVVARAAVAAGLICVRGEREKGVWMVTQKDIVRLGRDEWKEPAVQ